MAKSNKKSDKALKKAVDEILKDWKGAMEEAVTSATIRAQQDFVAEAMTCLERYYNNYDPSSYIRRSTHDLSDAFVPYVNVDYGKDKIVGSVGVEYDPNRLSYVVGSNDYGHRDVDKDKTSILPINEWVLKNYLHGIHPATDGSSVIGEAVYFEFVDEISPDTHMNEFIKNYAKEWDQNVLLGILSQVAKKMK